MTRYKPNVIRGGRATNIKGNLYYMSGRKHETGGIDIGKNPRTGLEVEDGEVVQTDSNGLKVFSAQPILNGNSPAKLVMGGANPAKVFNAQERFKEINGINDDGTKKKHMGGLSRSKDYGSNKKPYPSVNKKDFAGGGRSYPIPTRADAVDALRLAGLHGRSDVKIKVYKKYPDLKKKRMGGIREDYPTLAGEYYGRQEAKTIKALRNTRTNPQYQGRNLNLPTLSMNDAYSNLPITPSNRTAIENSKLISGSNKVGDILSTGFNDMIEYGKGLFNRKKKVGGKVVAVNGNVKSGLIISPSSTGERKKAAVGTDKRDKDYVVMNGQLYQATNDEFGKTAYIPIDEDIPNSRLLDGRGAAARKSDRQIMAAAKRDAKATTINSRIDKEVESAARRDAKGVRTDFRDMLERPQYNPNKIESKPKTTSTRSTKAEQPVQMTTTNKQTKVTAPRRGSGKSKPKAATKPAEPTKPAPKFADLNSMIQGINTRGAQMPTRIEPRTVEGASTNIGVPDVIESPRKRLALFDKLDTNDIIGLAGNIGGTVASAINTRKALNNMEAPSEPMYEVPAAMKTHFNIRPQISEINENTRRSMDDITANTASSRVALQRKQRLRNAGQYAKNNLYGQKENIETQLINQDRLNRQRVGSRNTAAYNDWRNRTTQFRNAIREQKASSLNNMFSGINAGLQDMLSRIENRRNYNNTLGIYDATHPNTDKRLFRDKGVTI